MMIAKLLMTLVLFTIAFHETHGHARMIDPLNRSSLWRKGYSSAVNRKDNQINCGGSEIRNGEKCGICGDDYDLPQPRPNENGGIYGKGMITHVYKKNSIINVTLELSGKHKGLHNFGICPLNDDGTETEECFYPYTLRSADNNKQLLEIKSTSKPLRNIVVRLKLPQDLTCRHCVLRWRFHKLVFHFKDNKHSVKKRKTWINCADISILESKLNWRKDIYNTIQV